jgi:hypothetical protein
MRPEEDIGADLLTINSIAYQKIALYSDSIIIP